MRIQKRTRSIALLLTLSLILSGIPMTPAHAAEILEPEETVELGSEETSEPEEALESEETTEPKEALESGETTEPEEVVESGETTEPEEAVESGETTEPEEAVRSEETVGSEETVEPEETVGSEETAESEEISKPRETVLQENSAFVPEKNVKMAGSDGVFYDDVLYLSARNVMAMSEKLQARYRRMCDEIAAVKNNGMEVENAVFAMDADGILHCSYSVSMRGLDVISAEMSPDLEDAPILNLETDGADLLSDIATEKKDETGSDEGEDTAKKKDDTNLDDGESTVEKKDGTNPDEEEEFQGTAETTPAPETNVEQGSLLDGNEE